MASESVLIRSCRSSCSVAKFSSISSTSVCWSALRSVPSAARKER